MSRKILILSDAWQPQVNGVVRTYENLKDALENRGHNVRVIGPDDFEWRVGMPSYPEIKLALFPYRKIAKIIKEFQPDIIHLSVEGPIGWAGRKYCLRHKVPFSTSYHTHFPRYVEKRVPEFLGFLKPAVRAWGWSYVRSFHKYAHHTYTASLSLEDRLVERGFARDKIKRLSRGVDTEIFKTGEKTLFQDLPQPVALCVGRVSIEKNIDAFLNMPWKGSKVIVGDGPTRAFLERKYPQAIFVGKKAGHELADHYRSADVFVFPSRTDTFGIVLIEALACGVPVAAYPVMGPIDIVTQDFLGCLHEDLETAVKEALERGDKKTRESFIHKNYCWDHVAEQFLRPFEEN